MTNSKKLIVSLCDYTGHMVQPWLDAGYSALLVDPQHKNSFKYRQDAGGTLFKFAGVVEDVVSHILGLIAQGYTVIVVFSFPPCTDMSVSGARWFASKHEGDNLFQAKAVMVAEQCRMIGRVLDVPWMLENPVSVLSSVFGKPDETFSPYEYTALEPDDNYTKKTCLWTGNGFKMPAPMRDPSLGDPDNRIHFASPGPERANLRSATPLGFARAVFMLNS